MKTITTALIIITSILGNLFAQNQTSNLVFFNDQGETFTISLNGQLQNDKPLSNVKITGLNLPRYKVVVNFTNEELADIDKDVYLQPGYEEVYAIKQNRQGVYTLIPQSQVAIGQVFTSNNQTPPPTNNNVTYTQTTTQPNTSVNYSTTTTQPNNNVTYSQSTTSPNGTYSQTTTTTTNANVNANMNVNAAVPGMNVNVNVNEPAVQTTTTTYTTSSSSSNTSYNTNTTNNGRCAYPMSSSNFSSAYNSVKNESFEASKLTVAKQIVNTNCLETAQVKQIMSIFDFEESKLDFAKYAYGKVYDPNNYFQLNDAFTFSSSTTDLNNYTNGFQR